MKKDWSSELESYLSEANLDGALEYIRQTDAGRELRALTGDPARALYARCLLSEVLDYAGLREEAIMHVGEAGADAKRALQRERDSGRTMIDLQQLHVLKQQCWCCLQLGMVQHYRRQQWEDAATCFELARTILKRIARTPGNSCLGSMSRAHYCLGLVAREQHDYTKARMHFSKSIEYAGKKLKENKPRIPVKFLRYCISRAAGLGMAWLAYARGSMSEAFAHLVSAQLLLPDHGAKYIRAYVDVVHACALRAAFADKMSDVTNAIDALNKAYQELGGNDFLATHNVNRKGNAAVRRSGHRTYAIRAAIELATAYLSAARLFASNARKDARNNDVAKSRAAYLQDALAKVDLVISVLRKHPAGNKPLSLGRPEDLEKIENLHGVENIDDPRTYCNALILGSRILREMGRDQQTSEEKSAKTAAEANRLDQAALKTAKAAAAIAQGGGQDLRFSQIDSTIACGDALFHCGRYAEALDEFDKAAADDRARTNPKVVAVCELQRARCYARLGDGTRGRDILLKWREYGRLGNENAYVRALETALNEDLDNPDYGVLSLKPGMALNPTTLVYWENEVYHWLAMEAIRAVKKDTGVKQDAKALQEAAKRLNMTSKTLKTWLERKRSSKASEAAT
jgi:tetratricopeptide (TPR) repeat protein